MHRKSLSAEQLQILYCLYLFRFGTTDLLLAYLSKQMSRQNVNKRLRVLLDQEYIGRRYDSSYKLQAKFATYFLLPKGLVVLQERSTDVKPKVLRNIRNDVRASERFIRHSLNIFSCYATLQTAYSGRLRFDTKSLMHGKGEDEEYPVPLPDAYICFQDVPDMAQTHFLMEYIDGTKAQSVWRQRINYLVEYIDTGSWGETDTQPALLFVCETPRLEKLVRRWAYKAYEDQFADDVFVATATNETMAQAVLHAKSPEA